jgi:hypothetical protein
MYIMDIMKLEYNITQGGRQLARQADFKPAAFLILPSRKLRGAFSQAKRQNHEALWSRNSFLSFREGDLRAKMRIVQTGLKFDL